MSTSTSLLLFQDLAGQFIISRRMLLLSPSLHRHLLSAPPSSPAPTSTPSNHSSSSEPYGRLDNSFDSNVIMVLSVLLCALVCSLGLNSIIRCALRCSSFTAAGGSSSSSSGGFPVRLANTGVKRKALKTFPVVSYSPELPGLGTECVICLSEFTPGERVRLLPKCHHGFHVRCIDKWLGAHTSCPTCRHCLIETCQKIIGCSSSGQAARGSSSELALDPPVQVVIAPLEPEGPIRSYHNTT
ncbi:hypothetical protein SAY87_017120 [Trapa incisa]|uniref:RING-type E3 ubiquitin transferase n=1 Tax=Trapa incisa TaxID=236973 RepID=A0AAN7LAH8_9MYRT|nr:hypothetical protein SAY87_017120 [Trapa incisa]